ncbi:hypothetical protein [Streptomyces griseomycini]|uniref:Transcriptional regulator with XRE-family HTH domain n=1 Tax=Streptomyces griseomycini TaxID=66895 RepID=A0A7W7PWV7_9ACTN|nr:hypothetical protein [Streptomyces griseomycini]MBB4902718.1 transcriptional regulator with XRE-family HTH domain [Streptomyces griseomycini]GGR60186.1 hypothetical protein GCM10015536_75500 [Streptomyces griseomycini]
MSGQELSTVGKDDDAHEKHLAFKEMLRDRFQMLRDSGLSQNQFATKYGYTSGRVSNTLRANADGTYFPRIKMFEELCRELAERCHVQDAALVVLRQRHRETLEALCAVDKPHHIHQTMLAELYHAEVVAELTAKVSSDQLALSHAIAERDTLREDRDDQRQRTHALSARIEQLQRDLNSAKAGKQQAILQRDRASAELDRFESHEAAADRRSGAELGVSHGEHPFGGARPNGSRMRSTRFMAAVAVVFGALAMYGAAQLLEDADQEGGTSDQGKSVTSTPPASSSAPHENTPTQEASKPSKVPTTPPPHQRWT